MAPVLVGLFVVRPLISGTLFYSCPVPMTYVTSSLKFVPDPSPNFQRTCFLSPRFTHSCFPSKKFRWRKVLKRKYDQNAPGWRHSFPTELISTLSSFLVVKRVANDYSVSPPLVSDVLVLSAHRRFLHCTMRKKECFTQQGPLWPFFKLNVWFFDEIYSHLLFTFFTPFKPSVPTFLSSVFDLTKKVLLKKWFSPPPLAVILHYAPDCPLYFQYFAVLFSVK